MVIYHNDISIYAIIGWKHSSFLLLDNIQKNVCTIGFSNRGWGTWLVERTFLCQLACMVTQVDQARLSRCQGAMHICTVQVVGTLQNNMFSCTSSKPDHHRAKSAEMQQPQLIWQPQSIRNSLICRFKGTFISRYMPKYVYFFLTEKKVVKIVRTLCHRHIIYRESRYNNPLHT